MLTKQKALLGRGEGAQENCSATRLTVSGFMVMGLVSRSSLANLSDSGCFLVAHAMLDRDGCQRGGFWEVEGHMASPFDLSQTLLIGGALWFHVPSQGLLL